MSETNYNITGKFDPERLEKVPEELGVRIYAIRDRKVIGAAPVQRDGSFAIEYKYDTYESKNRHLALGTYLVAGPEIPEDGILREKFPRIYLSPEMFQEREGEYYAEVPQEITAQVLHEQYIIDWFERYCYVWRPCIQIQTCSCIKDGVCYGERDLAGARVRIYAFVDPVIHWVGSSGEPYLRLVAEGNTDGSGRFRHEETRCRYRYMIPVERILGYRVEVGQVIDGAFNAIYMDPEETLRTLTSDLCEEIYINEVDVVVPSDDEGQLTGDTFKLTRISNIPVGYIEQDPSSAFYGYADSHNATDSATLKVRDSAFGRTIKFFANIGSGLLSGSNEVRHYRLKYAYDDDGTTIENYIQIPFRNLREATVVESITAGSYVTETMGPLVGPDEVRNVYVYANPYDTAKDKNWVYKGLIMVFDTRTLPLRHGRFTFTVEPLDSDMNPVAVANPDELSCTLLIDNTAPTATIGDISGPYDQAAACGFLSLDEAGSYTACDGNTRKQLSGTLVVPYTVSDVNENIWQIRGVADYGDVCDPDIVLQTLNYEDTSVVPSAQRPCWNGGSYTASSTGKHTVHVPGSTLNTWDQCAYQFRVTVYKRVTDGERAYFWWVFTKHVTLMEKTP